MATRTENKFSTMSPEGNGYPTWGERLNMLWGELRGASEGFERATVFVRCVFGEMRAQRISRKGVSLCEDGLQEPGVSRVRDL